MTQVLIFGDQAADTASSFRSLHKVSLRTHQLASFLRYAEHSLHTASKSYPLPSANFLFEYSLLELCEPQNREKSSNVAISTVLSCINQLGWLMLEATKNGKLFGSENKQVLLGACTGTLAAVTAACVTCTADLLAVVPEIITIAWRLGLAALDRSHSIETSNDDWTIAVAGDEHGVLESILEEFHKAKLLPSHRRAYVSASSSSATSVSGPPSTLRMLRADLAQSPQLKVIPIHVTAAFHADHLELPDLQYIIGSSPLLQSPISERSCVMFGSGLRMESRSLTLQALLSEAVFEIFERPQDWLAIEKSLTEEVVGTKARAVFIGPSTGVSRLQKILETGPVPQSASLSTLLTEGSPELLQDLNAIAVVGMSGRFPGGDDVEGLWQVLVNGRDQCAQIPRNRFDVETHYDPTGKTPNTSSTPYGCFYDHPDLFDASLFRMSPRQASQTDPIQRLLLLSAYEALEQAGYNPDNPGSKKIATFFAQSSDDWREVNAGQSIDTYMIPGGIRAFFPGIVNYHFGWEGPAISVDTACSGSAASVDLACSALLSNKCDAALVGGGNILTTSDMFAGLSRAGVLSPTGSCKTWDQGADGYCRADAVAVLVLKRFKDAVANRDNILAVVRGAATNHAPDASSITHPHAPSQAKLVNTILRGADVRPDEIDYVEMHGTGTQAGDVAETSTALAIFGGHRSPNRPLYIGTVKPNVGHSEAGSGVTSVIKSIMMFQKSVIPPHIGIKTVRNPDLPDIEGSNILIPLYKVPFKAHPSSDGKRRILINNYNITSGNTSLLLEDGPSQSACENEDPRSYHVIVVSGNSHNALLGNASRLESYLMRNPDVKVSDLSYSLTARRMHHKYRYAYATSNISDLRTMIARDLEAQAQGMPTQTVPVIFMFTGQGSLYVGMGAKLSRESSTFRNSILQSERTCQSMGMPSFVQLIIDSEVNLADFDTVQTQLALVAVEIALTDMWRSWGVTPSAVVGHSLGEYPALYTAGVLSRADMFLMVGQRARLLQNNCVIGTHAMLAVNLDSKRLGGILQDLGLSTCEIACYNGPQANVVSGPTDQITTLGRVLKNQGTQATELKVPYAFHSAQIDALLEGFRALAQTVPFQNPQVPVASTLTGTVHYSEDVFDADYFVRHAREPVRFMRAAQELESNGIATSQTLWMEMGSTPVCLGMLKSVLSLSAERSLPSLAPKKDAWEILSSSLAKAYKAGIKIKWHEYHRDYESSLTLLDLPSYAFDLKSYWIQYQGDWVVRKHRAALSSASTPTPQVPELKSTTLQKIISEEFGSDQASVQFTTDIQEEKLAATISGHLVGDFALCPSSIYADMAITAASYIWKRLRPNDVVPVFDVSAMSVRAPLVKKNSISSQVIKITAHKQAGSDDINMTVCSPDGEPKSHYADWAVKRGDANAWMQEWAKTSYLYQSRIDYLKDPARIGIHRLLESTVYKLFSVIVAYGEKFRGMQEVFMDGALSEATSRITFKSEPSDGKFVLSPYWFDALAHLSGFVLNAGDLTPPDLVYISHGWDGMRFAKPLSEDGNYQSYVRMQATHEKNVMAGDVYILCDDVIVAVIEGLRFQAMKKTVMRSLLSRDIATSHAGDTKTPKPARKVKPVIKTNDLPPAQNNKGGVTSLIAAELGVEPAEMRGDVSLADLGVDSLLIIEIQAKLKSELDIDVPSSFLAQPSTMIDLERYVENLQGHGSPGFTPTSSPTDDHFNSNDASSSGTPLTQPSPRLDPRLETSELKGIIAQELGVSVDEIDPHAQLSDLGLDSLLTIALLDQIREKTGKSLPVDFFVTYPTWTNIAAFIDAKAPIPMSISLPEPLPQRPVKSSPPIQPKKPERLAKRSASPVKTVQSSELASPPTHCSTTLLHGANDSHSASASLVLFPDGTGSPAPYTSLPSLRPDLSIIGLSSPFIGNPSTYTLSLNEVATIYAATINRAVPTGVLILGGLSIGGIFAYETARQLLSQGREIKGLLLLDAPCPSTAQAIKPNTLVQILDLLGDMDVLKRPGSKDVRLPAHIREHFFRSATALDRHVPATPSDALRRLPCEAIWATCGVLDSLPDAEYMDTVARVDGKGPSTDWMLRKRTTAGPQGWEALLDKVECHEIGTDHFRFCRQPHAAELAEIMRGAVGRMIAGA